jgi:hypothetical protein
MDGDGAVRDTKLERWAWAFILTGAVGITLTSACYALTPAVLALPIPPEQLSDALAVAGRPGGGRLLAIGGTIGVAADMIFGAAALVMALKARDLPVLGWALGAVSAFLFTVVDAMAARALSAGPAFPGAKALFDLLFIGGTFSFGVATLMVFWEQRGSTLGKLLLAVGMLGLVSALGGLFGAPLGQPMGIAIGVGVTLYATHAAKRVFRPSNAS